MFYYQDDINKFVFAVISEVSKDYYNLELSLTNLASILKFIPFTKVFEIEKINKFMEEWFENEITDHRKYVDRFSLSFLVPNPLFEFYSTGKIQTRDWDEELSDDPEKDYKSFGPYIIFDVNNSKLREEKNDYLDYLEYTRDEGRWDDEYNPKWYRKHILYPILDGLEDKITDFINKLESKRTQFYNEYMNLKKQITEKKSFKMFKEAIEIERGSKEVIAKVTGKESEIFTKIGKKLLEIEEAERRLKELKEEVKDNIRNEKIVDIFDQAEDKLKTRKIQTLSLILTISKDPAPRKNVAYKQVLDELLEMFPELVEKYNELVEKYTTITQLEPTVKATPFFNEAEENTGIFAKIKNWFVRVFDNWLKKYDMKLNRLRKKVESLNQR